MIKDYSFQREEEIIISEKGKIHQIELADIIYIESNSGVTIINKNDNKRIICSKNLKSFEINLKEKGFIRINRNEIVNCRHINEINFSNNKILINNDKSLCISKRNKPIIKEYYFKNKSKRH